MILHSTVDCVVEGFKETPLEDKVAKWYPLSLPQHGESRIDFLKRNEEQSYCSMSERAERDNWVSWVMARIMEGVGSIPIIRRYFSLRGLSAELFIGQQQRSSYMVEEGFIEGGRDVTVFKGRNLNPLSDIDLDAGFDPSGYFLKINVNAPSRICIGERIYSNFKSYFKRCQIPFEEDCEKKLLRLKS